MYLPSEAKTDSFHGGDLIIGREAGGEVIVPRWVLVFVICTSLYGVILLRQQPMHRKWLRISQRVTWKVVDFFRYRLCTRLARQQVIQELSALAITRWFWCRRNLGWSSVFLTLAAAIPQTKRSRRMGIRKDKNRDTTGETTWSFPQKTPYEL